MPPKKRSCKETFLNFVFTRVNYISFDRMIAKQQYQLSHWLYF